VGKAGRWEAAARDNVNRAYAGFVAEAQAKRPTQ
jgi:hypothetical protein